MIVHVAIVWKRLDSDWALLRLFEICSSCGTRLLKQTAVVIVSVGQAGRRLLPHEVQSLVDQGFQVFYLLFIHASFLLSL